MSVRLAHHIDLQAWLQVDHLGRFCWSAWHLPLVSPFLAARTRSCCRLGGRRSCWRRTHGESHLPVGAWSHDMLCQLSASSLKVALKNLVLWGGSTFVAPFQDPAAPSPRFVLSHPPAPAPAHPPAWFPGWLPATTPFSAPVPKFHPVPFCDLAFTPAPSPDSSNSPALSPFPPKSPDFASDRNRHRQPNPENSILSQLLKSRHFTGIYLQEQG